MGIKILNGGFQTLIEDNGRIGFQQYGVSGCGAMDSYAHRVGNILVGNDENEASLEALIVGPDMEFTSNTQIAITGADLTPMLNGRSIKLWRTYEVEPGDVLRFKGIRNGARAYIAIAGGIDVPKIMGSKSTFTRGRMGGFEGRALKKGDYLKLNHPFGRDLSINKLLPTKYIPTYEKNIDIRAVKGPQYDMFTDEGIDTFFTESYNITNQIDRMGLRLDGAEIGHKNGSDIISDGISLGAIQVPGHGKPIIMFADRQTTGGYTKIANVITADLYKIAQAKPGDTLSFRMVDIYEAQDLYREYEQKIANIKDELISMRTVQAKTMSQQTA